MTTLKYFGHAAWSLRHGQTSILIDPFLRDNPWLEGRFPADLKPDLILVTHAHGDHLGDSLEIATASGAPIVAMVEIANFLKDQGAATVDLNFGGVQAFPFGWVKMVPAWHSSVWTPRGQPPRATIPNGYVVRFFDQTFYHAGDTGLFYDMKLIGEVTPVDVALLPIGGHYTMGIDDAVKAVELIAPKAVIPMHYNTWPPIEQNPEDFQRKVKEGTRARCQIVKPGREWEVPAQL